MAEYDIIPAAAYQTLPSDPAERFLSLVAIAEASLSKRGTSDNVRKRFMGEIAAAADELGVGNLPGFPGGLLGEPEWDSFGARLSALKARLRLRNQNAVSMDSVELRRVTKAVIEQEVDNLRRLIDNADVPEKKKQRLREKLDEFIEELNKKRLSFAKLAAVAAAIAGVFGGTSVGLANAPEAIEAVGKILHLVGKAKAEEEEEQLLLSPPSRALPPPAEGSSESENTEDIA